jgi:hypothetical protein
MNNRYVLRLCIDKIKPIREQHKLRTKHYFMSMFAEYDAEPTHMTLSVDPSKKAIGFVTADFLFPNQKSLDIAKSLVKEYEAA